MRCLFEGGIYLLVVDVGRGIYSRVAFIGGTSTICHTRCLVHPNTCRSYLVYRPAGSTDGTHIVFAAIQFYIFC